jgi:predicted dehydrogenase
LKELTPCVSPSRRRRLRQKHLDGLKNIDGVEIVSIISRTGEQAAVAAKYGAASSTELEDAPGATTWTP